MGAIETRESFAERYLVDEVMYADEFEGYLKALDAKVYVLKGVNSDSGDVTDGLGTELEAALGARDRRHGRFVQRHHRASHGEDGARARGFEIREQD